MLQMPWGNTRRRRHLGGPRGQGPPSIDLLKLVLFEFESMFKPLFYFEPMLVLCVEFELMCGYSVLNAERFWKLGFKNESMFEQPLFKPNRLLKSMRLNMNRFAKTFLLELLGLRKRSCWTLRRLLQLVFAMDRFRNPTMQRKYTHKSNRSAEAIRKLLSFKSLMCAFKTSIAF